MSEEALQEFLKERELEAEELGFLVQRFDRDLDGVIGFEDFVCLFEVKTIQAEEYTGKKGFEFLSGKKRD